MKTAEEFLEEKGQMVFTHYDRKTLIWLMEQFRKEGMKEAYQYGAVKMDIFKQRMHDYEIGKLRTIPMDMERPKLMSFEEWYNNQIKEA